uniref:Site-specific integrase n=1 Tax=Escherichia coli TaxID=562 RepID=A0A3G4RTG1_ECOLX|nr:site-specific integrase [Escherichia coli]
MRTLAIAAQKGERVPSPGALPVNDPDYIMICPLNPGSTPLSNIIQNTYRKASCNNSPNTFDLHDRNYSFHQKKHRRYNNHMS